MNDVIPDLQSRICTAAENQSPLCIRGGGTKDFYGAAQVGDIIDVRPYAGIIDYEPKELVLTVRAGTPLVEIENALASERQMLPFEPPHFGAGATIAAARMFPRKISSTSATSIAPSTRLVNTVFKVLPISQVRS